MKKSISNICRCMSVHRSIVSADTFGTGDNQFEIEFVTISDDAGSANGTYIGDNKLEGFVDPAITTT